VEESVGCMLERQAVGSQKRENLGDVLEILDRESLD
jgi:hypothetical protein